MADNENSNENEQKSTNNGYGKALFGRRVIYTDVPEVTAENVVAVVRNALPTHIANKCDINYLYNYYKGRQPILERVKELRPEINNKVVVNYANEIVSFKVGYLTAKPIQYVAKTEKNDAVNKLNGFMYQIGKEALDQEIIEWDHICGTAYRYVESLDPKIVGKGEAPFDLYNLDPRTTAMVYSSTFKKKRMCSFTYTFSAEKGTVKDFVVYTPKYIFTFSDDGENTTGFTEKPNPLGDIPIFEYPANNARLGAFEIVLPLLDSINRIESNRIDGIEQQIQSFLKFVNCELDKDALENLRTYGAIKLKSIDGAPADVDTVKTDFSQDGAQVAKDDLKNAVLTICGMPSQGNGQSVSANNGAIIIQNGWSQSEARARSSETMFKGAERLMLNLIFKICRTVGDSGIDLITSDVDTHFTRNNYENIQVKAQVLCEMLNQPHIHPKLAFEACGLFSDPENAYLISENYYKKSLEEWTPDDVLEFEKRINNGEGEAVRTDGQTDSAIANSAS